MADDNPWTTLDIRTEYNNAWIQVDHHDVLNPAGNPGIYGTVQFHNRAVGILPLDAEGNTWLVGQYRYPLQAYHWEIPKGGAPIQEDLVACAQRELKEETGLQAEQMTLLQQLHLSPCITAEEGYIYLSFQGIRRSERVHLLDSGPKLRLQANHTDNQYKHLARCNRDSLIPGHWSPRSTCFRDKPLRCGV